MSDSEDLRDAMGVRRGTSRVVWHREIGVALFVVGISGLYVVLIGEYFLRFVGSGVLSDSDLRIAGMVLGGGFFFGLWFWEVSRKKMVEKGIKGFSGLSKVGASILMKAVALVLYLVFISSLLIMLPPLPEHTFWGKVGIFLLLLVLGYLVFFLMKVIQNNEAKFKNLEREIAELRETVEERFYPAYDKEYIQERTVAMERIWDMGQYIEEEFDEK